MAAMAAARGTAARVGTESRRVSGRGRTRVVRTRATAREGDDDAEGRDDGRDGMKELTDAFAGVGREVYDDFAADVVSIVVCIGEPFLEKLSNFKKCLLFQNMHVQNFQKSYFFRDKSPAGSFKTERSF